MSTPPATDGPDAVGAAGRLHILVVDDEEYLLESCQLLLEATGYEVSTADSGERAVALFERAHDEVSVVVLDMSMPGMSGPETFRALRAVDPGCAILIATGDLRTSDVTALSTEPLTRVIQKPYRIEALHQVLDDLVEARAAPS